LRAGGNRLRRGGDGLRATAGSPRRRAGRAGAGRRLAAQLGQDLRERFLERRSRAVVQLQALRSGDELGNALAERIRYAVLRAEADEPRDVQELAEEPERPRERTVDVERVVARAVGALALRLDPL